MRIPDIVDIEEWMANVFENRPLLTLAAQLAIAVPIFKLAIQPIMEALGVDFGT